MVTVAALDDVTVTYIVRVSSGRPVPRAIQTTMSYSPLRRLCKVSPLMSSQTGGKVGNGYPVNVMLRF